MRFLPARNFSNRADAYSYLFRGGWRDVVVETIMINTVQGFNNDPFFDEYNSRMNVAELIIMVPLYAPLTLETLASFAKYRRLPCFRKTRIVVRCEQYHEKPCRHDDHGNCFAGKTDGDFQVHCALIRALISVFGWKNDV